MFGPPEHGAPPFDFKSLHRAWLDCRRGKGNSPSRWRFEFALERNLLQLADELRSRSYRPSPSVCFVTDQPKRREIFAAAFRDRVVHHLLIRQLEPWWERRFIHDSYACRRGKGTLAAVDRLQTFLRQVTANGSVRAWYLHLDIRSFFVHIDKATLRTVLAEGIARQALPWAEALRWLAEVIVSRDPSLDAQRIGGGFGAVPAHKSLYHTGNLTGLPIGNYSSQFFANVYLDRLDQFVKHTLRVRHYLRYVDDLVLLDRDPDRLREAEAAIRAMLRHERRLELNDGARVLAPASNGIDALGYVVHHDHRLLRRRTVRRFVTRLRAVECSMVNTSNERQWVRLAPGSAERLLATCMSYRGLLGHANSARLCRRLQADFAWIGWPWTLSPRGRVRPAFRLRGTPRFLRQQWRGMKRCVRWQRLLYRIGTHWEASGADAAWLRHGVGLRAGRYRSGLGVGAGFHSRHRERFRHIVDSTDVPVAVWHETGGWQGALRRRELVLLILPDVAQSSDGGEWLLRRERNLRRPSSMRAARSASRCRAVTASSPAT